MLESTMHHLEPALNREEIESGFTGIMGSASEDVVSLARNLGVPHERLYMVSQVHGSRVVDTALNASGFELVERFKADAIISNQVGIPIAVKVADCAGVLMFDPKNKVVAAVHSGWKGTQLNIVAETIGQMRESYGSNPSDLLIALSPMAGQCCYEVGWDVAQHFEKHCIPGKADEKWMYNNAGQITDQLVDSCVKSENIATSQTCTICTPNFHSSRRDGERSGRGLAFVMIR